MVNKKLRKKITKFAEDNDYEVLFFDNPSFDRSIIGINYDGRLIYDYNKMVKELAKGDKISLEEAAEFIDYNTMRALPYFPQGKPIILYYYLDLLED